MSKITIEIDDELGDDLQTIAEERDTRSPELVREALKEFVVYENSRLEEIELRKEAYETMFDRNPYTGKHNPNHESV